VKAGKALPAAKVLVGLCALAASIAAPANAAAPKKKGPAMKTASVFYPARLIARAKTNAAKFKWARDIRDKVVAKANPWLKMSDDKLWGLMFGPTITRSWMVWSNGHCPSCKKSVPMYNWRIDALRRPWKLQCPHCKGLFPKNDFAKYYRSGLDASGVFDPKLADRKLLFNTEHPKAKDPLHKFGVDDGEGFVQGGKRWRFVGTYLIYGQWKRVVHDGIKKLAAAYVVTGGKAYAHKAAVLLDRVADLYPTFDHAKQSWVYETMRTNGYVSTWHDACEETREMALAYDQIRSGLARDKELVAFLSAKAKKHGLDNPKASIADIRRNIEQRILGDALRNPAKIFSNYPRADICRAIIRTVLDRPGDRKKVDAMIDSIVSRTTRVDGVTGEKGLAGYAAFMIQSLAKFLGRYDRADPTFLPALLKRQPRLGEAYRFHIDTHCLGKYYPLSGDVGSWSRPMPEYVGVKFPKPETLSTSGYAFLWKLYKLTGDAAFVQTLFRANGSKVKGLPDDLFAADPKAMQKQVSAVIRRAGRTPKLTSINKQQWHIAILRSGKGKNARATWLDYDSGVNHGHQDGMNLGLFAKGANLLPDFGYPQVGFGGWSSPRANWYRNTASHNTVVVDGRNQANAAGKTALWADGQRFRAIRASCPRLIGGKQYERTAVAVDISDDDFYLLDVFRVVGGKDHAKFVQPFAGKARTGGLKLKPAADYGHGTYMRKFRTDADPPAGWWVDWAIEGTKGVHLRYTDLTRGATASLCQAWAVRGGYNSSDEVWLPRVMVRRSAAKAPLPSTFVGVFEPYEGKSNIASIRRLSLQTPRGIPCGDWDVAVEITLTGGGKDLLIAANAARRVRGATPALVQKDWQVRLDGELCWIRRIRDGKVKQIALCKGKSVSVAGADLKPARKVDFTEVSFARGRPEVVAGDGAKSKDKR